MSRAARPRHLLGAVPGVLGCGVVLVFSLFSLMSYAYDADARQLAVVLLAGCAGTSQTFAALLPVCCAQLQLELLQVEASGGGAAGCSAVA